MELLEYFRWDAERAKITQGYGEYVIDEIRNEVVMHWYPQKRLRIEEMDRVFTDYRGVVIFTLKRSKQRECCAKILAFLNKQLEEKIREMHKEIDIHNAMNRKIQTCDYFDLDCMLRP